MQLTKSPDVAVPPRRFLPDGFDPAVPEAVESLTGALLERPIDSGEALRDWVHDWSELASHVYAEGARRRSAMTRDTRDETLRERNLAFQRDILPLWMRCDDRLNRRFLESGHRRALGGELEVFSRNKVSDAELFREENTDLQAEDRRLASEYQQIVGTMLVEIDGEELTPPRCAARLLERDRAVRKKALLALMERCERDRERIDGIFDELVKIRTRMARNAGFDNYRDYRFKEYHRFEYTPEDCERFHAAVEAVVVPATHELLALRRTRLGLETVRPYDTAVNLFGKDPERLFEDQESLVALVQRVFEAIDPGFRKDFDVLVRNGLLDLMSRPGKAPGGYNSPIEDIRLPFIFANAVGYPADVRVLLHEGGHAFHTLACRENGVLEYRHAPMEFAEVASMSMELFGLERLESVLGAERTRELAYGHLTNVLQTFPSVAVIDAFQHWVYLNPDHSREERSAKWVELGDRFSSGVDWTGLERYRSGGWQVVGHLFFGPLYYIEYGIAQIGALQMWKNERADHEAAVQAYRRALALGGSRTLPELFAAAGLRFAMDEAVFDEVIPDLLESIRRFAPD